MTDRLSREEPAWLWGGVLLVLCLSGISPQADRYTWLFFLTVCFCLAFSAFYELIEWWVALASEQAAEAFLGTQGDAWDTQTDMFLALIGSICALSLLGRLHDRQIERLQQGE